MNSCRLHELANFFAEITGFCSSKMFNYLRDNFAQLNSGPQDWNLSIVLYHLFDRTTASDYAVGPCQELVTHHLHQSYQDSVPLRYLPKVVDDVNVWGWDIL